MCSVCVQTKGLQAAYESATAEKPAADGVDSSEAVALKKQVDKLIQDKQRLEVHTLCDTFCLLPLSSHACMLQ